MLKLLLGVVIEAFIAVSLSGLMLALVIPVLDRHGLVGATSMTATFIITAVLAGAVALALFRPRSAIHRHLKR